MDAFTVQNLSFAYERDAFLLQNVSFAVKAGEVLGVLGPNGAGKTTLLKLLAGLLTASSGKIQIGGDDLSLWPRRKRAQKIAFVPQNEDLFLPFTVAQTVLMGRSPYLKGMGFEQKADFERMEQALQATSLAAFKDRSLTTLSGGEKQRVLLARALAQQAPLLLLDEPTSHLDIRFQKEILDLVSDWSRVNGITAVMTLHDINLASLYCDRILLLKSGRLHRIGPPQDVIDSKTIREIFDVEVSIEKGSTNGRPYCLPIRFSCYE